jgi:curved DNA-binding protein CbpA
MEEDYYEILEVDEASTIQEIKKAYHRLAKEYHTDGIPSHRAGAIRLTTERLAQINEAYKVLSDPAKRREYDELLKDFRTSRATASSHENEDLHKKTENTEHQKQEDFTTHDVPTSPPKSSVPIFIIAIFVGLLLLSLMAIITEKSTTSKSPKQVNRGKVSSIKIHSPIRILESCITEKIEKNIPVKSVKSTHHPPIFYYFRYKDALPNKTTVNVRWYHNNIMFWNSGIITLKDASGFYWVRIEHIPESIYDKISKRRLNNFLLTLKLFIDGKEIISHIANVSLH